MNKIEYSNTGFLFGAVMLGLLSGCIGYVEEPRHERVYVQPAPVYFESSVVLRDDYVYYPNYQVYFSGRTRQYVYLEGSSWVTRPAPPRVSVDVLFASPSVKLDFHDAPAAHHATIARTYPTDWAPPGWSHGKGHNKEHHRND